MGRVPHFSCPLREVGFFADTFPTLNERSVEYSPATSTHSLVGSTLGPLHTRVVISSGALGATRTAIRTMPSARWR